MFAASSYMVRKLKDLDVEILCLVSQAEVRYSDRIFYFFAFSEDFRCYFRSKLSLVLTWGWEPRNVFVYKVNYLVWSFLGGGELGLSSFSLVVFNIQASLPAKKSVLAGFLEFWESFTGLFHGF